MHVNELPETMEICTRKQRGVHTKDENSCVPLTRVVSSVMKGDWIETSENYCLCSGKVILTPKTVLDKPNTV